MIDNRIQKKLNYMGLKVDSKVFNVMRLISSIILFAFLLIFIDYGYIVAPLTTIVYYFFVEYAILNLGIKKRIEILENDALEFMPIFIICMKNTRNIKNAINMSVGVVSNELSLEFKKVIKSVELGKSLDEALNTMRNNIPSEIISNILISIIEANRLGNSINESINIQLNYIKERNNKKIVNKYKIVPFKLSIISVIFVFIMLLFLMLFYLYV